MSARTIVGCRFIEQPPEVVQLQPDPEAELIEQIVARFGRDKWMLGAAMELAIEAQDAGFSIPEIKAYVWDGMGAIAS